jgi:hypothetical protein
LGTLNNDLQYRSETLEMISSILNFKFLSNSKVLDNDISIRARLYSQ